MSTAEPVVQVDDDTYEDLLADERLVLLHFRANWCGPCNGAVEPVLADVAETSADNLGVAAIDAKDGQAALDALDVETLLRTVLLVDGGEVARFRGKTPSVTLERAVEEHR